MRSEVINAFHTVDLACKSSREKGALHIIRSELRALESRLSRTPTCVVCPDCGGPVDVRTSEAI